MIGKNLWIEMNNQREREYLKTIYQSLLIMEAETKDAGPAHHALGRDRIG